MKFNLLILFILIFSSGYSKGTEKIIFPIGYGIAYYGHDTTYYAHDTSYHAPDTLKSIWNIRKGNRVFGFSPFGNLVSVSEIKQNGEWTWIDTNKKEHIDEEFELNGICYLYYDDSTKTLAEIGEYSNNKEGENWKYFDRKGRLTELSYHMPFWTRYDYYDSTGNLTKEEDYTSSYGDWIKIREVDYINGRQKIIVDKMFIDKFILHFVLYYSILFFFFFFSRVFINNVLYTREGVTFPVYYGIFYPKWNVSLFSFWFSNYKPENKKLVLITNTFSIIAFSMFFGMIILFAINGDLH